MPAKSSLAPTSPEASRRTSWLVGGLLVAASVVAYYNSLSVPFFFDDHPAIERNETIRQLWPMWSALNPPESGAGVAGRPIINLSLALNYAFGGLDPRGYHAVNIVIHALGGLALWGLLRRTLRRRQPLAAAEGIAAMAALLWVVHPLQTESVVCVVQRSESLSGLLYLCTFYCFARSTEANAARRWAVLATLACLTGMAAKETMATAPLLLLLYDRTFAAGTFREAWQRRGKLYLALAATWVPVVWLMLHTRQRAGTVGFSLGMSSYDYLLTQSHALTTYLKLSFWPHPLVVDYGLPVFTNLVAVWPNALLIVTLLASTVVALRRAPALGFAGAWFFVILAPSSSIVPLTTQPLAEHRMYLPLAAVTLLVALGVQQISRPIRWALVTMIFFGLLSVTLRRNQDYRTELSLWTDTVAKAPDNPRAHASLAGTFVKEGRWPEALRSYETALQLRPDYADAQNDYALALVQVGRSTEAIAHYEAALRLKPDDPDIRYNLGVAFTAAKQWDKAIPIYQAVLRANPRRMDALTNLGDALLQSGSAAEALTCFEKVLKAAPHSVDARRNAASALMALNRWPEAVTQFSVAVELSPDDFTLRISYADLLCRVGNFTEAANSYETATRLRPDLPELFYNLGNLRLQLEQPVTASQAYEAALQLRPDWSEARHNLALALVKLSKLDEAVRQYEEVLRALPRSAQVHHNFALALAQSGRTAEAIRHEEIALELQPDFAEAATQLRYLRRR